MEVNKPNRDLSLLAPFFREKLEDALTDCQALGHKIEVFEGYRTPERQNWLFDQGRNRPGNVITRAKGGQSWHNYSLAVDIAFKSGKKWTWEGDWTAVQNVMFSYGFESLTWEKSHFQIRGGLTIQQAYKIATSQGLLALWSVVASNL